MVKRVSFTVLCGLLATLALNGIASAKPAFPLTSFPFEKFYTDENYIPECMTSGNCAIYVSPGTGNDATGDGSKTLPYKTLKKALAESSVDKYIIAASEGTYDGNAGENYPLTIQSRRYFLGGFYEAFTKRDNTRTAHKSIISLKTLGDNGDAETGIMVNGGDLVVDGFEFSDGNLNDGVNTEIGGAIQVETEGNVAITNNTFKGNKAKKGGAVYVQGKAGKNTVVVAQNIFDSNEAINIAGGAIYSRGGSLILSNTFNRNSAKDEGGAVYALGDTQIVGNIFTENAKSDAVGKGGAIVAEGSTEIFNNFLMANGKGSALYATGSTKVVNNTVVGSTGAGIHIGSNSAVAVNNLAAYNAQKGIGGFIVSVNAYRNENNAVWSNGGFSRDVLECDPKFLNQNSMDPTNLKLGAGSECIDSGQNYALTDGEPILEKDYFGGARNLDGDKDGVFAPDPGAHEIEGDVPGVLAKPTIANLVIDGEYDPVIFIFDISEEAYVTVTVKDTAGKLLNTLVSKQTKPKGQVRAEWDGMNTASDLMDYGKYSVYITVSNSGGTSEKNQEFELKDVEDRPATAVVPEEAVEEESSTEEEEEISVPAGNALDISSKCSGFKDVLSEAPLCTAVKHVKEKGIFKGYEDGTFGYSKPISRAEALKVVLVYFGQKLLEDNGETLGFKDLVKNAWYMTYVRTAKEFRIVQGYDDGTFKPDRAVARNEFLKIFFVSSEKDFSATSAKQVYADVENDEANSWFIKYAVYVSGYNLMDVDRAGNFLPADPMTRGDVAEFIYRFDSKGLK